MRFAAILTAFVMWVPIAQAQLMLPGALPQSASPASGLKAKIPVGTRIRAPGIEAVTRRDLALNGTHGRVEIVQNAEGASITSLTLDGNRISRPDDTCRVDLGAGGPVALRPVGQPQGMNRYQLALEACPFTFDVLDGAILANPMPAICELKTADCKVDPAGLWGPRGGSIGKNSIKDIERNRLHAETLMRENFRALLARTSGNTEVKAVASQQAGFSSMRATICRDYAHEDVHGYCALRITEARGITLSAAISPDQGEARPKKRHAGRGKKQP